MYNGEYNLPGKGIIMLPNHINETPYHKRKKDRENGQVDTLVMFPCPSFAKHLNCAFNSMKDLKCKNRACDIRLPLGT